MLFLLTIVEKTTNLSNESQSNITSAPWNRPSFDIFTELMKCTAVIKVPLRLIFWTASRNSKNWQGILRRAAASLNLLNWQVPFEIFTWPIAISYNKIEKMKESAKKNLKKENKLSSKNSLTWPSLAVNYCVSDIDKNFMVHKLWFRILSNERDEYFTKLRMIEDELSALKKINQSQKKPLDKNEKLVLDRINSILHDWYSLYGLMDQRTGSVRNTNFGFSPFRSSPARLQYEFGFHKKSWSYRTFPHLTVIVLPNSI